MKQAAPELLDWQVCNAQERAYTEGWRARLRGEDDDMWDGFAFIGWKDADAAIKAGRVQEQQD